jgi:hypothetical protein
LADSEADGCWVLVWNVQDEVCQKK